MESRISLALANKLRMIFEKEDKFLQYPQGVGFDDRYLNFMKDPSKSGLTLQEHVNNRSDFARLTNFIPADAPVYDPDFGRPLWDAVREVLVNADYAASALSDAEEFQLKQAVEYLTDTVLDFDDEPVQVYSQAVVKYYEYKMIYEAAEIAYLDEKITVESSSGPETAALRQQWTAYRERQLREARDKAMQDWQSLGNKTKVENFQAIQKNLEPRKYLNLNGMTYLSDLELSETLDLNQVEFCSTFFSPIDVFDRGTSWAEITLTRSEIDTLVASAPAALKALFSPSGGDGVEKISLEYNNVPVMRPWFRPEFFESRYWKTDEVISDGAAPRRGQIPAYVTSLIVVRNLTITRKTSEKEPVVVPIFGKRPLTDLRFERAVKLDPKLLRPSVKAGLAAGLARGPVAPTPTLARGAVSPKMVSRGAVKPQLTRTTLSKGVQSPAAIKDLRKSAVIDLASKFRPDQRTTFIDAKVRGTTIHAPKVTIPAKKPEPAARGTVTERVALQGVIVLAYCCKRVPRSPNPDTKLSWSE